MIFIGLIRVTINEIHSIYFNNMTQFLFIDLNQLICVLYIEIMTNVTILKLAGIKDGKFVKASD